MLIAGVVILATGYSTLTWCSVMLGRANPDARLPGSLPLVAQPRGYMSVGMCGLAAVVCGSIAICVRPDLAAWTIAGAVVALGMAAPFVLHNRRLPH